MKKYLMFLLVCFSLLLTGCTGNSGDKDGNDGGNDIILPNIINVLGNKKEIKVDESFTISVEVLPNNAINKTYEIEAYPEGIVEINGNTITGKNVGSAIIYVRSLANDAVVTQFAVNVKSSLVASGLSVENIPSSIELGEKVKFDVLYNGEKALYNYMIIPEDLIKIENDTIIPLKEGNVKIVFFLKDDYNIRVEKEIKVYQDDFTVINLEDFMETNKEVTINVLFKGTNISSDNYTLEISDPSILSFDNGKVKTLKEGSTLVTITLKENPSIVLSKKVKVVSNLDLIPESIAVNGTQGNMGIEEEIVLDIKFYPLDVSSQEFNISTYPENLLEVNGSMIKAIKEGSGYVIIESKINEDIKYIYHLNVYNDYKISTNSFLKNINLKENEHQKLEVIISSKFGSSKEYNISYSEEGIIDILEDGTIKPLKVGKVTVTIALEMYPSISYSFDMTVTEKLDCSTSPENPLCLDPDTWDWNYNKSGFDGKGMIIKLLHGTPEEVDPRSARYTGDRQYDRAVQIYNIEQAYNITLSIECHLGSWGTDRIEWIKKDTKGHILEVSGDWIPLIVEGGVLAPLENVRFNRNTYNNEQVGGSFTDIGYTQHHAYLNLYSYNNKVYGYCSEKPHANTFLYYNQKLIRKYGLEDPATLWNEGKWDWTTFYNFLVTAQQAFDSAKTESDPQMYAIGGRAYELIQGVLTAQDSKLVDPYIKQVVFGNAKVSENIEKLRTLNAYGLLRLTPSNVCDEFMAGNQLFQTGKIWYLSSSTGFLPSDETKERMEISVVPYPTIDGDALSKENYTVPISVDSSYMFGGIEESTYVIRKIEENDNGLTTSVLVNILDDLCRGLAPKYNLLDVTEEDMYRIELSKRIDSTQSVDAIMSVENNLDKYGYIDYFDILSKMAGNGSDFQLNGKDTWMHRLLDYNEDYSYILNENLPVYQQMLDTLIG
ncbi:MAG: hypothetical protein IJE45_03195 [Bacilli bacterium]|nr:hypothetical protein [Bacilli bacterium]